jgi:hypothetical protein
MVKKLAEASSCSSAAGSSYEVAYTRLVNSYVELYDSSGVRRQLMATGISFVEQSDMPGAVIKPSYQPSDPKGESQSLPARDQEKPKSSARRSLPNFWTSR